MNPLEFAGEVILVSASGVLSPGPLFFTNIIYGSKQGVTAGIKIAFGHTIVEFPLVIALALGLFTFSHVFANNENLKIISITSNRQNACVGCQDYLLIYRLDPVSIQLMPSHLRVFLRLS